MVQKWLLKRRVHSHINLMNDLREDPDDWRYYMRMDESAYTELLRLVTPIIQRQQTVMRESISPHERLSCTLRFLATGRSYRDLKFSAAISHQALSLIIPDTCRAIFQVLRKEYMKVPETKVEWMQIAQEFESKWNFPHCLGAVDGKHVKIIPPSGSGSYFFNYKEFGINGKMSDGGVIEYTTFYNKFKNNSLNIPGPEKLNDSDKILNYVFVGDEAFASTPNFLRPFNQRELTNERKIFNYRLSRARRVVENAFGVLANRFRIFHTSINLALKNTDAVVLVCCVLHNFLRRKYAPTYTPRGSLDFEDTIQTTLTLGVRSDDSNLIDLERGHYRSIPIDGKQIREQFSDYFNNEGGVYWQKKMCSIK